MHHIGTAAHGALNVGRWRDVSTAFRQVESTSLGQLRPIITPRLVRGHRLAGGDTARGVRYDVDAGPVAEVAGPLHVIHLPRLAFNQQVEEAVRVLRGLQLHKPRLFVRDG